MKTVLLVILIFVCLVYFFSRFVVFISDYTLRLMAEKPKETMDRFLADKKHYGYLESYDRFTALEPEVIYNMKYINIFNSYVETKVAFDIFSKKKVIDCRNDLIRYLLNSKEGPFLDISLYQLARSCGKFYEEYSK